MKTFNQFNAILSIFFLLPILGSAQKYRVTESKVVLKDYLHRTFAMGDKYVDINYASPHGMFSYDRNERNAFVSTYDRSMKQLYENEITEMKGKKYEAGFIMSGCLYIFATDKRQNLIRYELNPANGSATASSEAYFEIPKNTYDVSSGYSADSSHCFIVFSNSEKRGFMQALVLDKNMKVINNIYTDFKAPLVNIVNIQFLLSNRGELIGLAALKNKPGKKDNTHLKYMVLEFANDGKMSSTPVEGLPSGRIAHIHGEVNNNGFAFTGLLSLSEKAGFNTLVTGQFDLKQKKLATITQHQLEFALPEATTTLFASYTLKDLSHLLAFELRRTELIFDRSTGRYRGSNHYVGDAYIIKLGADKKLQWSKRIKKSQLEAADFIYTGTTCMLDQQENLHVFFHDAPSNNSIDPAAGIDGVVLEGNKMDKTNLVGVKVSLDGTMNRQIIYDNKDRELRFSPLKSYSIHTNEVIYVAYKWRGAGKSTYALGTLTLN